MRKRTKFICKKNNYFPFSFVQKLVTWSWSNESLLICRRSKSTQSAQPLYLRLSVPNLRTAPKRNKGQTFPHVRTLLTPLPIVGCRISPFRLSSPICHVLLLPQESPVPLPPPSMAASATQNRAAKKSLPLSPTSRFRVRDRECHAEIAFAFFLRAPRLSPSRGNHRISGCRPSRSSACVRVMHACTCSAPTTCAAVAGQDYASCQF